MLDNPPQWTPIQASLASHSNAKILENANNRRIAQISILQTLLCGYVYSCRFLNNTSLFVFTQLTPL